MTTTIVRIYYMGRQPEPSQLCKKSRCKKIGAVGTGLCCCVISSCHLSNKNILYNNVDQY